MQVAYGQVQEIECMRRDIKIISGNGYLLGKMPGPHGMTRKASKVTVKIGRITNYNVTYKFRVCFTLA